METLENLSLLCCSLMCCSGIFGLFILLILVRTVGDSLGDIIGQEGLFDFDLGSLTDFF